MSSREMGGEELEKEKSKKREVVGRGSGQRGKRALCATHPSCSRSLEAGEPSKLAGEPQAGPHSGPVSLTPTPWCLLLH